MLRFVSQLTDLRFNILSMMKEIKTSTYIELFEKFQQIHPGNALNWPSKEQLVQAVNELAARGLVQVEGLSVGHDYVLNDPKDFGALSDLKITF